MDWRITPRRLSSVLLLAAATLPLSAITPAPTAKTCEALTQWARDNRDSLPNDYRGLLAYATEERRAIYLQMTAEEQASFWSDRIGIYLEEHPDLSAGQLEALAEAKTFLNAEVYEALASPNRVATDQEVALFAERMNSGLGENVARELFYGLGPEVGGQGVFSNGPQCECRLNTECASGAQCIIPPPKCLPTTTGCGFGLTRPCIGTCIIPGPDDGN